MFQIFLYVVEIQYQAITNKILRAPGIQMGEMVLRQRKVCQRKGMFFKGGKY